MPYVSFEQLPPHRVLATCSSVIYLPCMYFFFSFDALPLARDDILRTTPFSRLLHKAHAPMFLFISASGSAGANG